MERLRLHVLSEQEPGALCEGHFGDVGTEDGTIWSLLSQSFTFSRRESQLRHFHACDTHCDGAGEQGQFEGAQRMGTGEALAHAIQGQW